MAIFILAVVGLAMGSFVNALTWRIEQQGLDKKHHSKRINKHTVDLSITKGRSVCIHCGHELSALDLIPVVSWLSLRGKCRYCGKKIEDSPLTELATSALFVLSYLVWPFGIATNYEIAYFVAWLGLLVGLVALMVYDIRHMLLPNRIMFPLFAFVAAMRLLEFGITDITLADMAKEVLFGIVVGGGFFYALYLISDGRWIGGGDVKLGYLIGALLGPRDALIALLVAFYAAAAFILPLMLVRKVTRKSRIPFGPFLIIGFIAAVLWADAIRDWYTGFFNI